MGPPSENNNDDTELDEDNGLYGPDSITWRIHIDPAMWIAAFSALALQSLHPRTMWGTYQNSQLFQRRGALLRLFRTADYVALRTFGTTAEAENAGQRVQQIHRSLTGIDEETGEHFSLDEPDNLLWVHCAEIHAYLHVARTCGIPLTDTEADTYVREQKRSAALVGLDPANVPGSRAELENYFARVRGDLRLTTSAKRGIRMWINTPAPPRLVALRFAYPLLGALGIALLPPWARQQYGVPSSGISGRLVSRTAPLLAQAVRTVMLRLPTRFTGTREQTRRIQQAKHVMGHEGQST